MTQASVMPAFRYRAFISYSHQDKSWAGWLHKALETYAIPKRLVGQTTAAGVIPKRLAPIFRDRDELASATDLGRKVNEALVQSANLIVICSPRSTTSHWVNEEVLAFKRLGRSERIFCLIVDGEPNASELPGRAAEECFAQALRYQVDANGQLTSEHTEPIAADVRAGKDGKTNAKLKLIAGLLDVGFDALKQREMHRRTRRMAALATLALVVMALTTALAIAALIARHAAVVASQAAERRQKQAEDLVGFMLGDLSDKLNEVHRLDIMQSVDDKAMAYFALLPAADATDAALTLRVNALEKIGGVRMEQGAFPPAVQAFQSAVALAAELARRAPDDMRRRAVWGDSLKWLGQVFWYQGDLARALQAFQVASALLGKAQAANPADNHLTLNLGEVRNNAGHVLEARGDFAGARIEYEATLKLYQELAAREPTNPQWQSYLGDGWNNLGKLALERGQLDQAVAAYRSDQHIKATLAATDQKNHEAQENLLLSDAILGRTLAWCGDNDAALRYTTEAVRLAKALTTFDPATLGFQEDLALYDAQLGDLQREAGNLSAATQSNLDALRVFADLTAKNPNESDYQKELVQAQLDSARLQLARSDTTTAPSVEPALASLQRLRAKSADDRSLILLEAQAHLLLGQFNTQNNNAAGAQHEWGLARDALQPALHAGDDPNFLAAYAEALLRLGQIDDARPIVAKLAVMGYRTPDFVALLASKQIAYPVNADFAWRIAGILQTEPVNKETGSTR